MAKYVDYKSKLKAYFKKTIKHLLIIYLGHYKWIRLCRLHFLYFWRRCQMGQELIL